MACCYSLFYFFYRLLVCLLFQLQPVFVNCVGDLFENQVVLFDAILKSGRYANQVWDHVSDTQMYQNRTSMRLDDSGDSTVTTAVIGSVKWHVT